MNRIFAASPQRSCYTRDMALDGKDGNNPGTAAGLFVTTSLERGLAGQPAGVARGRRSVGEALSPLLVSPLRLHPTPGLPAEDAQDLTQAFFAHLLSKDFLRGVRPEKGRFRSFLLTCLQHFLADEWERAHTAKRGGARPEILLDWAEAENRYRLDALVEPNPESLYERRWAIDLLDHALERLRTEAVAGGKQAVFDQLQCCLLGERTTETYAQLGARLGLSESAVKVTVHRLRQRYRELLREQIAHTVTRPEEIEEEMHYLFEVVSR